MKKAIVGIVVGVAVALAIVFMSSGKPPVSSVDNVHKGAAIQMARCDAAMSSLDAALGSGDRQSAIAARLETCTKAKAMVARARGERGSPQLDVAFERVNKHLDRLNVAAGSAAGSAIGSGAGSAAGSATGSGAGSN